MNCLYNGVELPALPEWDKGKYPVAYIYRNTLFGGYVLGVCDSYVYEYNNAGNYRVGAYKFRTTTVKDGAWQKIQDSNDTGTSWLTNVGSDFIIWTNTDILYEDGTVATKATEPVYMDADLIDHTSFLQGQLVGRWLVGMRK